MATCPHCGALNQPASYFCPQCRQSVHCKEELRPANNAEDGPNPVPSNYQQATNVVGSTLLFGVVYFGISMGLGVVLFSSAMGYAFGSGPISPFIWLCIAALAILQPPVALLVWLTPMVVPEKRTFEPSTLILLMLGWSFLLGWIRARLKRPLHVEGSPTKRDDAIRSVIRNED